MGWQALGFRGGALRELCRYLEGLEGLLLDSLDIAFEAMFCGGIHPIDEEDAFEVIDLVLDRASQEALAFEFDGLAIDAEGLDPAMGGATDIGVEFWEAEATLGAEDFFATQMQFRVAEDHGRVFGEVTFFAVDPEFGGALLGVVDLEHAELQGFGDLLCGEADALGVAHGFDHVVGEAANLGRDGCDLGAGGSEGGVTVFDNFEDHDVAQR